MEYASAWRQRPRRARARQPRRPGRGREPDTGVPQGVGAGRRVADVRQQHLPGPSLPRAADAAAGAVFPLPQPRREHAEGAGAPLGAPTDRGVRKAGGAPGAGRHPRLDPRTGLLPRTAVRRIGPRAGGRVSQALRNEALLPVSWRARPRGFAALMSVYESNYLRLTRLTGDPSRLRGEYISRVGGACDLQLTVL